MLVVAGTILAIGLLLASSLRTNYVASNTVVLAEGEEARAAAEAEFLASPMLARRVVQRLGVPRIYPDLVGEKDAAERALRRLGQDLGVEAGDGLVRLGFRHRNPERARQVLDALLGEYLSYPRSDPQAGRVRAQLGELQSRATTADAAYAAFLKKHDLLDYDADRAALSALAGETEGRRRQAEVRVVEQAARLAALERTFGLGDERRSEAAAGLAAARRARLELDRQARELSARRQHMRQIEPEVRELASRREIQRSIAEDLAQTEGRRLAWAAAGLSGPRILQPASVVRRGADYRTPILALTGLLALGGALWAGFLRLALRPGLRAGATAAQTLGVPLLGASPGGRASPSEIAELWAILGPSTGGPCRMIMVTSARRGEGASSLARELALHAARKLGRSVWLADLDLALSGQVAALSDDPRRYGRLSGPVQGSPDGSAFFSVRPQAYRRSGEPLPEGAYLAAHRVGAARWWVTRFLKERLVGPQRAAVEPVADYWSALRRYVEVVIVDAPAAEVSTAALSVARFMDQVVLVVAADERDIRAPARYRNALESQGAALAGVFVTKAS